MHFKHSQRAAAPIAIPFRLQISGACSINMNDCTKDVNCNNGECIDGIQSYTCSCFPGYYGADCSSTTPPAATAALTAERAQPNNGNGSNSSSFDGGGGPTNGSNSEAEAEADSTPTISAAEAIEIAFCDTAREPAEPDMHSRSVCRSEIYFDRCM